MMIHKRTLVLALLGFCSLFSQDYYWPIEFRTNFLLQLLESSGVTISTWALI